MYRWSFCRSAALALACAVGLVSAIAAERQADPTEPTRAKLARIGADLFSTAPHAPQAIDELRAILAAEPGLADAHMLLGIAYRVQGSSDLLGDAVAELRQALSLDPSLTLARLTLARVYLDMARPARAREELESALEDGPRHPQILSLLGETERQLGKPQRSMELNRQALDADPAFVQARYYLGLALLDARKYADAVRELKLVVESGANPAEANAGLGLAYLEAGRAADAVRALREAVRLAPSRPDFRVRLARAYREAGRTGDAAKELQLARPALGSTSGIYQNLDAEFHMEEGLLRMQQGRLEEAAQAFERVLQMDVTDTRAKGRLAEVRRRIQQARDAKKKQGGAPE